MNSGSNVMKERGNTKAMQIKESRSWGALPRATFVLIECQQ